MASIDGVHVVRTPDNSACGDGIAIREALDAMNVQRLPIRRGLAPVSYLMTTDVCMPLTPSSPPRTSVYGNSTLEGRYESSLGMVKSVT